MKKNNYSLGQVKIDNFRTNLTIERNLFTYAAERYGFNISLVVNDLLTHDFKCGSKVKLNIQKQLIKNSDNTIDVVDFDGNTYHYELSGDHYLCLLQKGNVLKEETVSSVTTYKLFKSDNSYEKFDSSGKILGCYDKSSNLIFTYTYSNATNLLTSFATGTNEVGINISYSNGLISRIDTFDNQNVLQLAHSNGVTATIGNVLYQINSSTTLEVFTKTAGNVVKRRLTKEKVDGVVVIKEYSNNIVVNHITLESVIDGLLDEVYTTVTDVLKGVSHFYKYDDSGKLIYQYEVFDNMFNEDMDEGCRFYKGDVLINDSDYCGVISPPKSSIGRTYHNNNGFTFDATVEANIPHYFVLSMWIKGNRNISFNIFNGEFSGELQEVEFVTHNSGWNFVHKMICIYTSASISKLSIQLATVVSNENITDFVDDIRFTEFNPQLCKRECFIKIDGIEYSIDDETLEYVVSNTQEVLNGVTYDDLVDTMTRLIYNDGLSYIFTRNKTEVHSGTSLLVRTGSPTRNIYSVELIERVTNGDVVKETTRCVSENTLTTKTSYSDTSIEEITVFDKSTKILTYTKDSYIETYNLGSYDLITQHSLGSSKLIRETFTYDEGFNFLVTEDTFNTKVLSYEYDNLGRLLSADSIGYTLANTYTDGNLTKLSVNNNDIIYGYTDDLVTTVTKGDITYTYQYDHKNRVTKVLENGYTLAEYVYVDSIDNSSSEDSLTKLITSTISKRVYTSASTYYEIKESYDKYNKLLKVERISGSTTTVLATYTYETPVVDERADEVRYCGSTPLLKETKGSVTYGYEYENQKVKKVFKGTSETPYFEYTYDKFGRLTQSIQNGTVRDNFSYKNIENPDNIIQSVSHYENGIVKGNISYSYDIYGRVITKSITYGSYNIEYRYTYYIAFGKITNLVGTVKEYRNGFVIKTTSLEYDENQNIKQITEDDVVKCKYEYDSHNRLEIVYGSSSAMVYSYDDNGNITSKKRYSLTSDGELNAIISTINYGYSSTRKNILTSYNGSSISTNYLGAPNFIGDYDATYSCGKLSSLYKSTTLSGYENYTYTYNSEGFRTEKRYTFSPGKQLLASYEKARTTTYTLTGSRIDKETLVITYNDNSTDTYTYTYKYINNELIGFTFKKGSVSTDYYYEKNIFGDIIKIYNSNMEVVGSYSYDEYGKCTVTGSTNDSIAYWNHFRYRGYYYDDETGLFWCNSRYYNPEWGRWLSPDDIEYLDPQSINGLNLYAYCFNDPVNYVDPDGHFPILALILTGVALVGMGLTIGGVASDNNTMTAIGLTMVTIPALISGGLAAFATSGTLATWIGAGTMVAGVGTGLFASAEYQEAFTDNNWMLDAGMSEGWYNGLMLATASLATLGTAASSFAYSFDINSIQKIGKVDDYYGIKFTQKAPSGKLRVKTLGIHPAHNGHPIHWQLNNINPATGGIGKKIRWDLLLRRLIGR